MGKRYRSYNILIIVLSSFLVIMGFIGTFAFQPPTDLKQQTGVVSKFNQREGKWYDHIFGGSTGSYLRVWFKDDTYFEATGICYDYIDESLFETIQNGDEITITYFEKGGVRKICAIEYKDKMYLSLDVVLKEYRRNEKIAHIVGPIVIALTVSVGIILFIVNHKKNRGR